MVHPAGTLEIGARKCTTKSSNGCSAISGVKRLTFNGTLRIIVHENHTIQAGDSIRVWTANSFIGKPKIEVVQTISESFVEFDDSRISEGILIVKSITNGIQGVKENSRKRNGIYDLNGRKYDNDATLPKGIYIINGKKTSIK